MTFLSADQTPHSRPLPVVSAISARVTAAWKRYQAEQALEGLSYDTLKDIGFPSIDRTAKDQMTR